MANIYVKSQQAGESTTGSGTYRGVWTASTTWAVGDRVVGVATVNYYVMECTTGGAGSTPEPTWSTTPGNTTADGAATFTTRLPSTWANATIDLTRAAVNDAAGDFVYVSDTHAESTAASIIFNWAGSSANPTRILCVDDSSGEPPTALATTATVSTTGTSDITIANTGHVTVYGIRFNSGVGGSTTASIDLNSASTLGVYSNCYFNLDTTGSASRIQLTNSASAHVILDSCTFQFSSTSQMLNKAFSGYAKIIGCTIAADAAITNLTNSFGGMSEIIGCDFSNAAAAMNIGQGSALSFVRVINTKLPASWSGSINSATPAVGAFWELHNSDATDTNYRYQRKTTFGIINSETTLVRTGGASDGTTTLSWKMATTADAEWSHQTLNSSEIVKWNETTGSAITATIEILHDSATALTDKEIWVEVQYLGTSGFPLSLFVDDAASDYLASAANQTSSSATWTTTGMSNPNKQSLSVTFTPQEKGFIHAVVKMAKASYTAYVDPVITVS